MKQQAHIQFSLFKRITSFARPFRKPLYVIFTCVTLVTIIDAINSLCLSRVFDIVQKHGADRAYLREALLWVGLAGSIVFLRILVLGVKFKTQIKKLDLILPNYLNHESIRKFFSFSVGQHVNEHSGVKQTIVNSGTTSIQNQINLGISQVVPAIAQFFVSLCVLFYTSTIVGFIFLCIGAMFCVMMYYHNKKLIPGIRKTRDQKQWNSRLISEVYRLVGFIKTESQEDKALSDVAIAQGKHQDVYQQAWLPATKRLQSIRSSTALVRYGVMFLIVYLLFTKQINAGAMFLCFTWTSVFIVSLWDITDLHKQFLMDKINIERYFELLEIKSDIVMAKNPIKLSKIEGRIEFRNVTFYYPRRVKSYEEQELEEGVQNSPVLKNVSFVIDPGQTVGIVGESGSGKSTMANLIRRAFDPQQGQILIDGDDLRLLDLRSYLQKVGSVEQDVMMLDRSIRDNILFGLDSPTLVSEERMKELARMARIDGFFPRLEHGFDTLIGEKGVKLSGGEKQRVGIARALAKEPPILIFDEATSALDSVSERIVQQSIDEVRKGKTAIIIAHRLSTVKNCDKIFVFRHGVLLAEGTHEYLLEECDYYADLVQHQMVA